MQNQRGFAFQPMWLRRTNNLAIILLVSVGASEWTGVAKPQAFTCRVACSVCFGASSVQRKN